VGHYVSSDFSVLINEVPWIRPLVFNAYEQDRIADTQIRQKLCDIAGGVYRGFEDVEGHNTKLNYALDDLALRHLGEVLEKENTWRLRYGELIPVPFARWPREAVEYPKKDVRTTVRVFEAQEKNAFFLADQFRQARASFWLRLMATWGLRTDEAGIRALAERTSREYERIAKDLRAAGLLRSDHKKRDGSIKPGARDTKAAQARVVSAYTRQGREVPLTDGGKKGDRKPCLDKVTCEESADPLLINYAALSSLKKVLGTDIPLLRGGIVTPIHSTYEDLKESGRVGSSKPNVQNQPRAGGVRECFVPRCLCCSRVAGPRDRTLGFCLGCRAPLTVMWSCDYGGLELCTLAQACFTVLEKSRLGEALNAGLDPHLIIASQLLKRPYEELKAVKKAGKRPDCVSANSNLVCHCDYCTVIAARQTGKVANFGFMGGLGPAALVFFALNNYDVHITEEEARVLKRVWLETWPEMREYFAWISTHTDKPFPQIAQLFSGRYRGGVRFTEAANTIPQGLGADIAKSAGWGIVRACYDPTAESVLYGSRVDNFVHDEFVGESPEPIAHECAFEVRRLMLEAAKPWLPDVKIDVEPALMWRYSKDAQTQYRDGRLVPWAA
jgi:hypothetical protein